MRQISFCRSRSTSVPAFFCALSSADRSSRWWISAALKSARLRKCRPLRFTGAWVNVIGIPFGALCWPLDRGAPRPDAAWCLGHSPGIARPPAALPARTREGTHPWERDPWTPSSPERDGRLVTPGRTERHPTSRPQSRTGLSRPMRGMDRPAGRRSSGRSSKPVITPSVGRPRGSGWGTSRTTWTVIRFGGCLRHARYGAMGRIEPGRGQARPRTNRHADREAVMGFDQQDRHFAPRRTAQTGLTR